MGLLTEKDYAATQRIADEVATYGAAEVDKALDYVLRSVADLIDAADGTWVAMVRTMRGVRASKDPQLGWRGRAVRFLDQTPHRAAISRRAVKSQESPDPFETTRAIVARAGKFRSVRLRELVDFPAFRRTAAYHWYYKGQGISDRMAVSCPLNDDLELHYIFDRKGRGRRFTDHEVALATQAIRALSWFHRRLALSHGVLGGKAPLSPMKRRVLALLLSDLPEKMIAQRLGQSIHTTHTHVRSILALFATPSRTALMALWLKSA